MWQDHPDQDVRQAIIRLNDALCTWERSTGRESVLIIREQGGFSHRSMSGKPGISDDVTDEQLLKSVLSYDDQKEREEARQKVAERVLREIAESKFTSADILRQLAEDALKK